MREFPQPNWFLRYSLNLESITSDALPHISFIFKLIDKVKHIIKDVILFLCPISRLWLRLKNKFMNVIVILYYTSKYNSKDLYQLSTHSYLLQNYKLIMKILLNFMQNVTIITLKVELGIAKEYQYWERRRWFQNDFIILLKTLKRTQAFANFGKLNR